MKADIITVGDEILIGQIVNTNASWIAGVLTEAGIQVVNILTIADDADLISATVTASTASNSIAILTGGLGPTHDDVTRDGVAAAFGKDLLFHEDVYRAIEARFEKRGRKIPESNRVQAMVPDGFTVLQNEMGSAPGLWYEFSQDGENKIVVVVPGVPREMKWLFNHDVLPRLRKTIELPRIAYRTLSLTGIGESNLQDLIRPTLDQFPDDVAVAFLPNLDGVRIRLGIRDRSLEDAEGELNNCENKLRDVAGKFIYTTANLSIEEVIANMLSDSGLTISIAESCTGGLISSRLTDVPGSSRFFKGAVVAYSNDVKRNALGVDDDALKNNGAVSAQVARKMAEQIRQSFGSDIGISTSGIMGPTGGTDEKPVGTVWFGFDAAAGSFAVKHIFGNDRIGNKRRSSTTALNLIRVQVQKMLDKEPVN